MCSQAGAAHVGSSLSVIDILAVLYGEVARISPTISTDPERDIVLVSKGHAAAGVYAVMGNAGFFPISWLDSYCQDGAPLGGHVTANVPGVELSTGALGHALPFGVGRALAALRDGSPRRTYVVLSDGECDEGSNWEAALLAGHHELGNLTVIIDRNGLQSLTTTELTLRLEPLADKWAAFGWSVQEVDGHDHAALITAMNSKDGRPTVVIAATTKGRGVDYMEGQVPWHYKSPNAEQLADAITQLEAGA
jgi:transketolase